jgi:hypothetical protein
MCVHEKPAELSSKSGSIRPDARVNVARYDDDYPLLYGEPAVQPEWDRASGVLRLNRAAAIQASESCRTTCRSCGRCRGHV